MVNDSYMVSVFEQSRKAAPPIHLMTKPAGGWCHSDCRYNCQLEKVKLYR
ncbi:MAG: sulfatase maturation enzyme AslB (radical SAM superfamily) [Lentimonas sp.]|jgi:sulfatase maturation enzyme AslB (radical SAM superfamily)